MGLAGRKDKQRIGVDPRNTTWADDASRFGKAYLEKFGWSNGTGLGTHGDGLTSHIKVMHKLDLMGIGANRTRDGDEGGQGRDYERLLKRLNENAISSPTPPEDSESTPSAESVPAGEQERPKKKRKKEKDAQPEATEPPKPVHVPRPMAHRSKFLRSKNMVKNSEAALNEILGISTSASNTPTPLPATPTLTDPNSGPSSGTQTPGSTSQTNNQPDLLSTSTKSVADYFAEKLAARKKSHLSTPAAPAALVSLPPESSEPSPAIPAAQSSDVKDEEERKPKEERKKKKKEKKAKESEEVQTEVDSTSEKDKKKPQKRKEKAKEEEEAGPQSNAVGNGADGSEGQKEKKKKKKRKSTDDA